MNSEKTGGERLADKLYYLNRIGILFSVVLMFFPGVNPAKVCGYINKNMSLLTSGMSYNDLVEQCTRAFRQGWIYESSFQLLFVASLITCIGIAVAAVCGCMSLGNVKMKKTGNWFAIGGSIVQIIGLMMIKSAYTQIAATDAPKATTAPASAPAEEEGGSNTGLIIGVVVVAAVAAIGGGVFAAKKKKGN